MFSQPIGRATLVAVAALLTVQATANASVPWKTGNLPSTNRPATPALTEKQMTVLKDIKNIVLTAIEHAVNFRRNSPLSDAQKSAAAAIFENHSEEIRNLVDRAHAARKAMRVAVETGPADSPDVKAAAEALGEVATDRALLAAVIHSELKPILTAEQLDNIAQAREDLEAAVDQLLADLRP